MSTRDGLEIATLAAVVTLVALAGANVAAQDGCGAIDGAQVCVTELSVSDGVLVTGDRGEITATVENVGNETASPAVVLNVVDPANETSLYTIGQPTVEPAQSVTVSQPLDANTTGIHGFQVQLVDGETRGLYDASEPVTLKVVDEAPPGFGGPVDRVELSLVALVVSLVGIATLGYRQVRR